MKVFGVVFLVCSGFLSFSQTWTIDQANTYLKIEGKMQDPPKKLSFTFGNYDASAVVSYTNEVATIQSISWKGVIMGNSLATTLEEAIYKNSGKLRKKNWDQLRPKLTAAITKELAAYKD